MSYIEVVRDITALARTRWRFFYDDRVHGLRITSYTEETRRTLRHKYRATVQWSQHYRGERPTIPPDVQGEAVTLFQTGIRFVAWDEK